LARGPDQPAQAPSGGRRLLFARLQPQITPLLQCINAIASGRGVPAAAVALNWCRSHGAMPIVGLRSIAQAQDAAAAAAWTLDAAERQELDAAASALPVRMPANPFSSG
jgi:pyridoxine 4-dehydrogenase